MWLGVSPGEVVSIYGLHLGPARPISATFNAAGFLPTTLGGVQVTIDGTAAPLLYVSDTQINAIAPVELMRATSSLNVMTDGASLPAFRLVVDPAIPEVFRHADLSAAAINQDNSVNSATNPAKSGSFVSIWVTGAEGTPGLADGQLQTAAEPGCGCIIHNITQNKDIIPSYQGAAPGMVNGIVQVNFQVANPGDYYWLVTGNNQITSDAFSLFVSP